MIEMERKKVGLKKGAVPNIFPNCPSYLTDTTASCQRLSLYDKEEKRMHEAYKKVLKNSKKLRLSFLFPLLIVFILNCL